MNATILSLSLLLASSLAHASDASQLLKSYAAQAGSVPDPARGQRLFATNHGRDWSCASCHGAMPVADGRHAATGKPIAPMAPAINPQRFSDPAKSEKWFRRNCNDVLGRECQAVEKADILAWLLSLKPAGG